MNQAHTDSSPGLYGTLTEHLAALPSLEQQQELQPAGPRPRIGILSGSGCIREGGWPVYAGDAATVNAVFEAGGYPVIIATLPIVQGCDPSTILTNDDAFEEIFAIIWPTICSLDGLVLVGNAASSLSWHNAHTLTGTLELWRGVWEHYFALAAWILCIPTLGICRGMQVMNVVRGGGFFRDVRAEWPKDMPPLVRHLVRDSRIAVDNWVEHPITIHPKSRLAGIFHGSEEHMPYRLVIEAVLSMHSQIIGYVTPEAEIAGYLASGLAVGATAPDGVIEAIEDPDQRRYWVGVQFHPEWTIRLSWALRLFTSLIAASRTYASLPQHLTETERNETKGWLRHYSACLASFRSSEQVAITNVQCQNQEGVPHAR